MVSVTGSCSKSFINLYSTWDSVFLIVIKIVGPTRLGKCNAPRDASSVASVFQRVGFGGCLSHCLNVVFYCETF